MKAFLLAAGEGTRLRPITNRIPKCMVPIRGVPMLSIWLRICEALGIDEILINVHAHADAVKQFAGHAGGGVRMRVIEEETLLGSAGTLRLNRGWVESEECFWVFYADVLNQADLKGMLRQHRRRQPVATLGVYEVPDPRRCGIVSLRQDGMVEQFVEKPDIPTGNLAFSGLMIGTPAMLEAIPDLVPADIGFHVLPKLGGKMLAFPIQDYLLDVGTLENYHKAQDTWPGLPDYA
jgi:mannose-1-phosphate guanylyltransferase